MKIRDYCQSENVSRTTVWRRRRDGDLKAEPGPGGLRISTNKVPRKETSLVGRRFGALVVQQDSGRRTSQDKPIWLCQCDCGQTREVEGYFLRACVIKNCGCGKKAGPPEKDCGGLSATRWRRILHSAKRRGIEVPITQEQAWELFEKQGGKCALSGLPITLRDCSFDFHPHAPRWIEKRVAKMRMGLTDTDFRHLCAHVALWPGEDSWKQN